MKNNSKNNNEDVSGTQKLFTLLAILAMIFCFFPVAHANNLIIQNVSLDEATAVINFDISQDNSWRFSSDIHDAAWVFIKYSVDGGDWKHATITTNADLSSAIGTTLTSSISSDNRGIFIYRDASAQGRGTLNTSGVKLTWNAVANGVNLSTSKIALRVFALEMVHIPTGAFYVGSGGTEEGAFYKRPNTTDPYLITSEGQITVGTADGNLYYPPSSCQGSCAFGGDTGDQSGPIPAVFPKGYQAFYIMKYELTQGQYRDFLNTLTRVQQDSRTGTSLVSGTTTVVNRYVMSNSPTLLYRNGIRCDTAIHATNPIAFYCDLDGDGTPNESNDGEFIACTYLSWADLCAYADWAALRPMTELEFEKAARGIAKPVANEYPWGTTDITKSTSVTNGGANNETAAGNCNYNNNLGPLRSGYAAISTSTRSGAGASFYGVMDLAGNVGEHAITIGQAANRLFDGTYYSDGALNFAGEADVTSWPVYPNAGGTRGGYWNEGITYNLRQISSRFHATWMFTSRYPEFGCRLARSSAQ